MKAKLVIKLGALDDLVDQLKRAASGGMEDDVENEDMEYEEATGEPKAVKKEKKNDEQAYSLWVCEQCGAELKCTMPKQMMNCPCCNGAAMTKVKNEGGSSVLEGEKY
jgi:rubrerythrin